MIDYILNRIEVEPGPALTGCWQWLKAVKDAGYAVAEINGRMHRMHRTAFVSFRGEIPTGLDLDHLCRNRSCVNPWHLEPVTRSENLNRSNLVGKKKKKGGKGC